MIARARLLLAPLLGLSLLAPLAAQERGARTFDLRAVYKWKAGDKLRVTERRDQNQRVVTRAGLQVVDEQNQRIGWEQRYRLDVTKVDDRGRIAEATRTYESLTDLARGEKVEVAGLKVRWVRREDGSLAWEPPEGATLDPFVREVLDEDREGPDTEQDGDAPKGAGGKERDDPLHLLLPAKPVVLNEVWELPLDEVGDALGIPAADVLEKKLQGKLAKVEAPAAADGPTFLEVELEVRLKAKTFQGMTCTKPVEYELTGSARLPAGGQSPDRRLRLGGQIRGTAPAEEQGAQIEFEVRLSQEEQHERIAQ